MAMERFDELLSLLIDGAVSPAETDELVEICRGDSSKLEKLRHHLDLSDRLSQYDSERRSEQRFMDTLELLASAEDDGDDFVARVLKSASNAPETRASPRNRGRLSAGWIVAVVAILACAGILIMQDLKPLETITSIIDPAEINDPGVAVLTRMMGVDGSDTDEWSLGMTVAPGPLKWDSGIVQLEFYCGATVVVEGPASLRVVNDMQIVCESGKLRANVPEPARGFAVLAPSVELVDLGTEFAVEVNEAEDTEVHVFNGRVELYDAKSNRDESTRRELVAGEAVRVMGTGELEGIEPRNHDFVTLEQLNALASESHETRMQKLEQFHDSLRSDPRVAACFPFKQTRSSRELSGFSADNGPITGAIVGARWTDGRWPGKSALEFKSPGDRVRVNIPGEFESLTWTAWVRIDGLDRHFSSLLLTDGFDVNRPHWQIHRNGNTVLGIQHSDVAKRDYESEKHFDLFGLGRWTHIATVYDGTSRTVSHYINGQLSSDERLMEEANGSLTIGSATIGNWTTPSTRRNLVRSLNGRIDELIVFNEALPAEEIQAIYAAVGPVP